MPGSSRCLAPSPKPRQTSPRAANDKFQSFVAHAVQSEAETPAEQPSHGSEAAKRKGCAGKRDETPAEAEGPFSKLRRWLGA